MNATSEDPSKLARLTGKMIPAHPLIDRSLGRSAQLPAFEQVYQYGYHTQLSSADANSERGSWGTFLT